MENLVLSSIIVFTIEVETTSSDVLWNLAKYGCSKTYSALGLFVGFICNNY